MDQVLDVKQIVSGIAILISFFVGFKYGSKVANGSDEKRKGKSEAMSEIVDTRKYSGFKDYKMILVVRNDLKMGKGKIAAQCGHAAVGAYELATRRSIKLVRHWENSGSAKVAVKVESEKELMLIRQMAIEKNLNVCLIRDAGRTQIEPNTKTVLAVGPGLNEELDTVTGHLKLL